MLVRVEPRERRQRHPRSAEALQHGPVEAVVPRLADRLAPDDDSERALVTQQAADVNDAVLCVAMGSSRRVQVRPAGAGAARRVQVRPAGAGRAGGYAYNYSRRSHVEDAIVLHVLRELLPGLGALGDDGWQHAEDELDRSRVELDLPVLHLRRETGGGTRRVTALRRGARVVRRHQSKGERALELGG